MPLPTPIPYTDVIDPFTNVDYVPMPVSTPSNQPSYLSDVRELQAGFGNQVFRADQQGIWLGASQFTNAPFSVDMLGNLIASLITIKNSSGQAIIDSSGIVSTTNFTSVSGYGTGGDQGTTSDTYQDVSNLSISFTLARSAKVLIQGYIEGFGFVDFDTPATTIVGMITRLYDSVSGQIGADGLIDSHTIANDAGTQITTTGNFSSASIVTLAAGTHIITWQFARSTSTGGKTVICRRDRSFLTALVLGT